MILAKTLSRPIKWEQIDFDKEIKKHLYHDGFDMSANHGVWKLKYKLTPQEWSAVREYFQYYEDTDESVKNMKYYGWATTNPVKVIEILLMIKKTGKEMI